MAGNAWTDNSKMTPHFNYSVLFQCLGAGTFDADFHTRSGVRCRGITTTIRFDGRFVLLTCGSTSTDVYSGQLYAQVTEILWVRSHA